MSFYISARPVKVPGCPSTSLPMIVVFVVIAILVGVKWYLVVLISIFLMTNDVE